MMNSKTIFHDLVSRISETAEQGEVNSLAYIIMEHLFDLSKTDIAAEKPVLNYDRQKLAGIIDRLTRREPVQYILGEAEFYGRKFKVNSSVLIPRPETEELVRLVISKIDNRRTPARILDIGTGSGCIPVTLALEMPLAEVIATDVSQDSLHVAMTNARMLKACVHFICQDILKDPIPFELLDVVVSNPPYITMFEKAHMPKNVTEYEPHLALFVPDNDPLIFYKAILAKAGKALKPGGIVAVEINERLGREVAFLFQKKNFNNVQVVRDMSGKDRMVTGISGNR